MIRLLKDYYLTADGNQFILFQEKVVESGKSKGKRIQANHKFFPRIEQLLSCLLHKELYWELDDSTIKTVEQILEDYKKVFKEIIIVGRKLQGIPNFKELLSQVESIDLSDIPEPQLLPKERVSKKAQSETPKQETKRKKILKRRIVKKV